MARLTPPLSPNLPMTDKDGKPTPFFMRWWQEQVASNAAIANLNTPEAVSAVLDVLGAFARGQMLYRGAAIWELLEPDTTGKLLVTKGAAADPAWETLSSTIDTAIGSTQGNILFRGAAGWEVLGVGTAGDVLSTNGAAADPSWITPSAGATIILKARHWRIKRNASVDVNFVGVAELGFNGTTTGGTVGGTPSASTEFSATFNAAKAFDGNLTTGWATTATSLTNAFIAYDFTTPTEVSEFYIHPGSSPTYTPTDFDLECSLDGTNWLFVQNYTTTWATNVGQAFTVDYSFGGRLTDLIDTPDAIGTVGQILQVNADGTAMEFAASPAGTTTFLGLTDTPGAFTGQALLFARVNAGETALEFVAGGGGAFTDLSDTPGTLGTAGQMLQVNAGATALEFVAAPSGGGGGGSSLVTPTIRATSTATGAGASTAITLPTGAAAGDLCLIFVASAWTATKPAGWFAVIDNTGTNIGTYCYHKVLDAADITLGTATVTFSGSFAHTLIAVCYNDDYAIDPDVLVNQSASGATSATFDTEYLGEYESILLFGANRVTGTASLDVGSLLQAPALTNMCAALNVYANAGDASPFTTTATYSGSGTGHVESRVRVLPKLSTVSVIGAGAENVVQMTETIFDLSVAGNTLDAGNEIELDITDAYMVVVDMNDGTAGSTTRADIQLSTDGGSTWLTTSGDYQRWLNNESTNQHSLDDVCFYYNADGTTELGGRITIINMDRDDKKTTGAAWPVAIGQHYHVRSERTAATIENRLRLRSNAGNAFTAGTVIAQVYKRISTAPPVVTGTVTVTEEETVLLDQDFSVTGLSTTPVEILTDVSQFDEIRIFADISGGSRMLMQLSPDAGSTWRADLYSRIYTGISIDNYDDSDQPSIGIVDAGANAGVGVLYGMSGTYPTTYKSMWTGNSGGTVYTLTDWQDRAEIANALRFFADATTISVGTLLVVGVKRVGSASVAAAAYNAPYDVGSGFGDVPTTAQILENIMIARELNFEADFAGSYGYIAVNPTGTFDIDVQDDGVSIGTISISVGGTFVFTTTSNTAKVVAAGSKLTFIAPVSVDATAANAAWTLFGTSGVTP